MVNEQLQLLKEMRPLLKKGDVAAALLMFTDATIKMMEKDYHEEDEPKYKLDIHILLDNLVSAARGESINPDTCIIIEGIAEQRGRTLTDEEVQALYDHGPKRCGSPTGECEYKGE